MLLISGCLQLVHIPRLPVMANIAPRYFKLTTPMTLYADALKHLSPELYPIH